MDPSKCLEILQARSATVDAEKDELYRSSFPISDEAARTSSAQRCEGELLSSMSNIGLMNLFTALQGERVQVYLDFNNTLTFLSKEGRLAEYPNLCAEVTSRFSVLSKKINTIKDMFDQRSVQEIVVLINHIQSLEKEKLLLIAAQHLDIMHLNVPSLAVNIGNLSLSTTDENAKYADTIVIEIQQKISESLEDFQSLKCDYSD